VKKKKPTTVIAASSTDDGAGDAFKGCKKFCFQDEKIAVSGVFQSMSRDAMEELVLIHGGKVSSAVSGKTTFLLAGNLLEDGRSVSESAKYKTAVTKQIPIITEDQFLARIHQHEEEQRLVLEQQQQRQMLMTKEDEKDDAANHTTQEVAAEGVHTTLRNSSKALPTATKIGERPSSNAVTKISSSSVANRVADNSDMLWVDKYKPTSSSQLIGSAEVVKKIVDWLKKWHDVHVLKKVKIPFSKENPGAKAALLSGPPGIGKSTVASLAARELGYDVMELNASDTRNRKEIEAQLTSAVSR